MDDGVRPGRATTTSSRCCPTAAPTGSAIARTYDWPDTVTELPLEQLREERLRRRRLQRPHELEPALAGPATCRRVYVEHNTPQGRIADMRHPMADRDDLTLVHVTHFNELFWDAGATPTRVIEHGIVDPARATRGELPHAAVVINEARRRGRVTGTDLLERFRAAAPLDLFGMDAPALGGSEDLPQRELHDAMARRRVYLHPIRWTSLGPVAARGDAPRHAGRRARDDRGLRGGAARGRRASPPASTCCATRCARLIARPGRGPRRAASSRARTSWPLRPRALPDRLGRAARGTEVAA